MVTPGEENRSLSYDIFVLQAKCYTVSMRTNARAVVLRDDKMLVMKRFKMGKEYYTLLGGTIERNEQPDAAAVREVFEESTVVVDQPRLVFIEEAEQPFGPQYIFLCKYVSGEPSLPPDSEEAFWTAPDKNTYEPMWLPVAELPNIPFVSPLLKEALIMALKHGWPKEPYRFSSKHSARLS